MFDNEKYDINQELTTQCLMECINQQYTKSHFIVLTDKVTKEHTIVECIGGNSNIITENVKTVIGSQVEIILLGFNNNTPIVAKVDTGASFCSIHATNIEYKNNSLTDTEMVLFDFNDTKYKMPLVNKQTVQNSDGAITYRPVVEFNVSMNDKTYEKVLFNLNDRSEMTHKILLGQNLLTQSRVLVDPTLYMESFSALVESKKTSTEESKEVDSVDIVEDSDTKIENKEHSNLLEKYKNLTLQDIINSLEMLNS